MSLMQFLTSSRSINSAKDKPSPFRMKQPILLPRFGRKSNFSPEVDRPENIPGPELGQEQAQVAAGQSIGSKKAVRTGLLQDFLRRRGGDKTGSGFVQAELSLETVQVVRNDLTEGAVMNDLPLAQIRATDKQREGRAQPWWKRLRLFAGRRKQD
jgi:hypothetical protein